MAIGVFIEQFSQHRIVIKFDIFISNFNIKESGKTADGIFILNANIAITVGIRIAEIVWYANGNK